MAKSKQTINNPQLASVPTETRGQRLTFLRKMIGLSMVELAEKYELGYSTLKQWETERHRILSDKGARSIVEAMKKEGVGCSLQWLLHGSGSPPIFQNIEEDTVTKNSPPVKEIVLFKKDYPIGVILEISDESMKPYLEPGDTVGGMGSADKHNIEKIDKKLCIIQTEDQNLICRWLEVSLQGDFYNLLPFNLTTGKYPTLTEKPEKILKIAPVTHIWKKSIADNAN